MPTLFQAEKNFEKEKLESLKLVEPLQVCNKIIQLIGHECQGGEARKNGAVVLGCL